jgi:hypothetical protein
MKKALMVLFVVAIGFAFTVSGFAAEKSDPVKYTGNVVSGSVNTVGEAVEGTTKTAVSPFKAFWNFLTGKGKGENVVTDPVNEGGRTIYKAGKNTANTVGGRKY